MERLTFAAPPSPPHRHNYQELLVVERGQGSHQIDGRSFPLAPQTASLIGKGQVHFLEQATGLDGYVVRFSDDFLPTGIFGPDWNYQATLFNHFGLNRSLVLPPADLGALGQVLGLLAAEYAHPDWFQRENGMRHLLALALIHLERTARARLAGGAADDALYRVYQEFTTLLERYFPAQHDVGFYAERLGVAPARLARLLSRLTGKTTKQLISERVLLEAQRFLRYTPLAIGAIAEQLGFSDQFQFSKAFKRGLGVAPQSFRASRQKMT